MSDVADVRRWLERISRLSMISIEPQEEEEIIRDVIKIIDFFNKLSEVDVEDVEPLFMTPREAPVIRDDEKVGECLDLKDIMVNVKERVGNYIKGPKII